MGCCKLFTFDLQVQYKPHNDKKLFIINNHNFFSKSLVNRIGKPFFEVKKNLMRTFYMLVNQRKRLSLLIYKIGGMKNFDKPHR